MDSLDRQPGEKFHTWAKRVHEYYLDFYCVAPYPISKVSVNNYIEKIRNGKKCYNCGSYIVAEPCNYLTLADAWEAHSNYLCNGYCLRKEINARIKASITLQMAWRRKKIIYKCKIRFLQKVILAWLYRPNGKLMKNVEKHYYQLAMTQSRI